MYTGEAGCLFALGVWAEEEHRGPSLDLPNSAHEAAMQESRYLNHTASAVPTSTIFVTAIAAPETVRRVACSNEAKGDVSVAGIKVPRSNAFQL